MQPALIINMYKTVRHIRTRTCTSYYSVYMYMYAAGQSVCDMWCRTYSDNAEPIPNALEGVPVCDIVHYDKRIRSSEIHRRQSIVKPGVNRECQNHVI